MEKDLEQPMNRLIDVLNNLENDIRSLKDRINELYIAILDI